MRLKRRMAGPVLISEAKGGAKAGSWSSGLFLQPAPHSKEKQNGHPTTRGHAKPRAMGF